MIRHLQKGIELPLGVQEFTTILYSLSLLVDEHSVPVRAVRFLVAAFVIRVQVFHPSHCELLTGACGHGHLQFTDAQQALFVSCPLFPETTALVSRPKLHLPAAQSLSSAMLLMIFLTTLSFVSNLRDTAGQERFRTITTAYYRGAMVSVFQGFVEVKHAYSFIRFVGFKLESSTLKKIDFLM